jgi:hypothetical protein
MIKTGNNSILGKYRTRVISTGQRKSARRLRLGLRLPQPTAHSYLAFRPRVAFIIYLQLCIRNANAAGGRGEAVKFDRSSGASLVLGVEGASR